MTNNSNQQELFDKSWNIYRKVLDADYMHHKMFSKLTLEALTKFPSSKTISFLDIGCGDGAPVLQVLKYTPIETYTGIDLSETAIAYCRKNLFRTVPSLSLKCGDMSKLVLEDEGKYDVVYSSFAIHHLSDDAKSDLFKNIGKRLHAGGRFIYIDVCREEGQSLNLYRKEYADLISQWTAINTLEKSEVIEHINHYDFPAYLSDMKNWFESASMKIERIVKADNKHVFISLVK